MKKNRLIFYGFFALFHLFIFFFSLYVDSQRDNFQFLLTLQQNIGLLKFGSLIGIILLAVDVIWLYRGEKSHLREKVKLEDDMNKLKAKLFDLQESSKKPDSPKLP